MSHRDIIILLVAIVLGLFLWSSDNNEISKARIEAFLMSHLMEKNNEESFGISEISYGDLDNDGLEDAVVAIWTCGVSCGSDFLVIKNNKGSLKNLGGVDFAIGGTKMAGELEISDGYFFVTHRNIAGESWRAKYRLRDDKIELVDVAS